MMLMMLLMNVDGNDDDNDDRLMMIMMIMIIGCLASNGHLRVYQALAAGFWSVSRVGICKFFQRKKVYFREI